jgi:hypothetical protein
VAIVKNRQALEIKQQWRERKMLVSEPRPDKGGEKRKTQHTITHHPLDV